MEEKKEKINKTVFLSVIIPAYNEEKNILSTLKKVENFLNDQDYTYEVLVMDDGSLDSTAEIASNFARANNYVNVHILKHRGKAPTVLDGMNMAKGKYILFTDADSATPIEELKKLLYYATDEHYDLVIGSREGVGAVRKNEPFTRHLMGRVFNLIVQFLLIKGISDTQCGFKLFTNEAAKNIVARLSLYRNAKVIKQPKVTAFDVEVLFVAKKLKYKIKSVPVEWQYIDTVRVNPLRDSLVNFWDVVKVFINDKKGKYK